MEYSKLAPWAALVILLALTAGADASPVPGDLFTNDACPANCVATLRSANNLLVVARDSAGAVFSTHSFRMPGNAVLVSAPGSFSDRGSAGMAATAGSVGTGGQCLNQPGLCTETSVRTYSTPTHYLFYTYTYIYRDGNLAHIEVEESRVLRNEVK